ncbi:hypothetical protein ACP70R_013796 [Stipagrostis hirtigluma subsp. patula]
MSRCFPYPPPGYVRNPVAVAEAESTAKLQKEKGTAEKKKEKRSDKKALQQGDTSKHSKHGHKKRKHEDVGAAAHQPKRASKESVEQLEKSGLSEEHGAPCFIQTVRDSPESSQDSSKRRKVVLASPSQAKNGNILRIKIRRDQDSHAPVLEKPKVLEQPTIQQKLVQHQNKVNVKSAAAAAAQQRVIADSQAVHKQVSTQPIAKYVQRVDPRTTAKALQQIDPKLSVKAPARADHLPGKMLGSDDAPPVRGMTRVDPTPSRETQRSQLPPAKMLQRVDTRLPLEIQRKCPPACAKVMQKDPEVPLPIQKPKVEIPVVKQHQQPVTSLPKEEPCFSGRKAEAVQEVKQSRSERKKIHKAEKKERKFRDLFVTWDPPSFDMEDSDLGEQDWLCGNTRNSDASMTDCRASDGSMPFQPMEQQLSLQPRATLLPELHIYQMPYVVPF